MCIRDRFRFHQRQLAAHIIFDTLQLFPVIAPGHDVAVCTDGGQPLAVCLVQVLFIDDSAEILRKFEQTARNMHSLSRYSRSNQINREWIEEYLNEAHSKGLVSIRAHCNVMAWSDDREKLKRIKNDVGSQLALMEAKPRHNTVDVPTLFWAAIPGNAGDFPSEAVSYTHLDVYKRQMIRAVASSTFCWL